MNKIGTSLAIYNANGFSDAFKELGQYTKFLTEEEQKMLGKIEQSVADKTAKLEKAIVKFNKDGFKFVTLKNSRNGKSTSVSVENFAEMSPDGKLLSSRYHLFGLSNDLATYQNINILTANELSESDLSYARLGSVLKSYLSFDECYGTRRFVFAPYGKVSEYQKVFDTAEVINLSDVIADFKAAQKANRKIARASGSRVEAGDAQLLTVYWYNSTGSIECKAMSYNDVKSSKDFEGKTVVAAIRPAKMSGYRDYIATFKVPTSAAEEKTFTAGDISVRSVRNGVRDTMINLDRKNDYVIAELKPADYKRLKLWRDTDIILEGDALKEMYEDALANVPALEMVEYTDCLLDQRYIGTVKEALEKGATDADKETKFYKRFMAAAKRIEDQTAAYNSATYKVVHNNSNDLETLEFKSPITKKVVTPELFADYPMLKYFGYYNGQINVTYDNRVREVFDYVALIESK